jgi:ketosteroid isomerase-like protein
MTSDNANVAALRRAYDRWSETRGRSVEDWLELAHPKFRMRSVADQHVPDEAAVPLLGREGMRSYLEGLLEHWIMERHDVERFIADGDQVAAVIRAVWRNRETNKRIATDLVDVWAFEGGRAVSMVELFDSAAMLKAATPDPAVPAH